ncbi:unnamed protein product [Pleuronectes platessa]|uniref:Uncharacterized protein n=1 Tax=Pleuronectes platessa TaxID=8262 RepID=A0A9N7YC25_PLEPL|nr:unnamed protein product [Pleuronectes platessa]
MSDTSCHEVQEADWDPVGILHHWGHFCSWSWRQRPSSKLAPIKPAKPSLSGQAADLRTPHQQIGLAVTVGPAQLPTESPHSRIVSPPFRTSPTTDTLLSLTMQRCGPQTEERCC